jgi:hypothetical protein
MISAESEPVHHGTEGHRVIVQEGWGLTAILNAIKVVSTGQNLMPFWTEFSHG